MDLFIPKHMKVKKPETEPHLISKRGVNYWFAPYWCREVNGTMGRILPSKGKTSLAGDPTVDLHMVSKDGNVSYIQGSIQEEFKQWHEDRQLDAILLGFDEDSIIDVAWVYE